MIKTLLNEVIKNINTVKISNYALIIIKIILTYLITKIILYIGYNAINKFFKSYKNSRFNISGRKLKTMTMLIKNIFKYVMYFIMITFMLSYFNIKVESILAVAGIGGVALGFGAQGLVKDIITGFFILFEDQFGVGDYITVDKYSGIVEELGLRSTKIREVTGSVHVIPNSTIGVVTNHSTGSAKAIVEVKVNFKENVDHAIKVLDDVCGTSRQNLKNIVSGPEILGLSDMDNNAYTILITAGTKPNKQLETERQLRYMIKHAFDDEKINCT